MNVLITGVTGFIGRHAERAFAAMHNVFGVARSATLPESHRTSTLIAADLSTPDFVKRLPSEIDCVIHLAQSREYREFPEGAEGMRRINIEATCELLEWSRRTNVKHFIFTSTANVYGGSTALLTESHPTRPDSFYGASKLAAEHLARQYNDFFQVDILRLFTVYGPGQSGMLIPNIAERIKLGQTVTLAEGVGVYLTPVYVGDVVDVMVKLTGTKAKTPLRLLNVCGDKVTNLSEIVNVLEFLIDKKARIQITGEPSQSFTGVNDHLRQCLNDLNFTDLEPGLANTVNNAIIQQ